MNQNRRKILKFLVIGSSFGLLVRFFGADFVNLLSDRKEDTVDQKNFNKFNIVEGDDGLKIYSKNGEELFVIDNEK